MSAVQLKLLFWGVLMVVMWEGCHSENISVFTYGLLGVPLAFGVGNTASFHLVLRSEKSTSGRCELPLQKFPTFGSGTETETKYI